MPPKKKNQHPPPSPTDNESSTIVQIQPYLYLAPRSATAASTALAAGITHIISIGCSPEKPGHKSISYHRLSLLDTPTADLGTAVLFARDIIDQARAASSHVNDKGVKILIHCVAAVSRSPAVIAAYLVEAEGMTLREALRTLVEARPVMRPNDGFLKQLKKMEIRIRGEGTLDGVEGLPVAVRDKRILLGVEEREHG